MPVSRNDEWVRIAKLTEDDQIKFTAEYLAIMGHLGWNAKAFVGHLIGLWYDPFEHLLDNDPGDARVTVDQPRAGAADGELTEALDVAETWPLIWSKVVKAEDEPHWQGLPDAGLGPDWYRDMLRAKLVSLRVPRRLLEEYARKLAPPETDDVED